MAKITKTGSVMYAIPDPDPKRAFRMKAVISKGMPTRAWTTLILMVEFLDSLTPENKHTIKKLLPSPLNKPSFKEEVRALMSTP